MRIAWTILLYTLYVFCVLVGNCCCLLKTLVVLVFFVFFFCFFACDVWCLCRCTAVFPYNTLTMHSWEHLIITEYIYHFFRFLMLHSPGMMQQPSVAGRAHGCPRKLNGRRQHEADWCSNTTPGGTNSHPTALTWPTCGRVPSRHSTRGKMAGSERHQLGRTHPTALGCMIWPGMYGNGQRMWRRDMDQIVC